MCIRDSTYHITKPLIVTDKGIVNTGILKIITDILDGDNIPYSIYDKTVPNPTDENVTEGVAQYKADGCDGLISIGGGSSHDCCKGIGILLSNGGAIYQYEGVDKVNHMPVSYTHLFPWKSGPGSCGYPRGCIC